MPIAPLWHVTLRAVQHWWQDNCLRLAASLAYYTALSLAPLVLLIVGVVGLVLDRQQVATQLTAQLEGLMGPAGRELITSILAATSPEGGALATVIGLVTLFIGATAVFGELQATMNLIWEVHPAPTGGVWAGIWAYAPGYAWVPLDNMPLCCNGHTLLFACIVVIEYVDRRGRQLL
jgi:membrane protein